MADNDQIIGGVMAGVSAILIVVEFIFLIIQPAANPSTLNELPAAQYWAMAAPAFIAIFGVLGIVLWIGYTMMKTPPPQEWEFEDIEEGSEAEPVEEAKKSDKKVTPKKKEAPEKKATKKADPPKKKEEAKKEAPKKEEKKEEPKAAASGHELTDIKGVGASTADELKAAGFDTVEKIANASIEELTKTKGVGKASAKKYIDGAKELL